MKISILVNTIEHVVIYMLDNKINSIIIKNYFITVVKVGLIYIQYIFNSFQHL